MRVSLLSVILNTSSTEFLQCQNFVPGNALSHLRHLRQSGGIYRLWITKVTQFVKTGFAISEVHSMTSFVHEKNEVAFCGDACLVNDDLVLETIEWLFS